MASDIQRLPGDVLNENGGRFANTYTSNTWENVNTFSSTTYIDQNAYIRKGAWLIYDSNNATMSLEAMPAAAIPARGQIQGYALKKPYDGSIGQFLQLTASGPNWANPPGGGGTACQYPYKGVATYYDPAGAPGGLGFQDFMPRGWYKVEVLLKSSSGANAGGMLNQSVINAGRIKCVQGMAFSGSTVYATFDGLNWLMTNGDPVGSVTCHLVQISFLYHFPAGLYSVDWRGTALTSGPGWSIGASRYTYVQLAPDDRRMVTTQVPTEAPTAPPTEVTTEVPTEGPTAPPTEPPTEGPTDVPTDPPTQAPAYFRIVSGDNVYVDKDGFVQGAYTSVNAESNMESWTMYCGDSWVDISPAYGPIPKEGVLGYWQIGSYTGPGRMADVVFYGRKDSTGESVSYRITIHQEGTPTLPPTNSPASLHTNSPS